MLSQILSRAKQKLTVLQNLVTTCGRPAEVRREVSTSIYVDAPSAVVFETVTDPAKPFLTANPVTEMTVVGDQTRGAGTVYRWTFRAPVGPALTFDEVVTEWVKDERVTYRAISGWEMKAETVVTPEAGGTRVTFTLRYRLPRVLNWVLPRWLDRRGVNRAVRNIRRHAEAQYHDRPVGAPALIEFSVDIDAPPAEVFRVVGDPRSKRVWVPAIKRVDLLTEYDGLHTEYIASSGIGPLEFPFREQIIEWDPPTELGYAGMSRWGHFRSRWRLDPRDGGTRAAYRMDFRFGGGIAGRLVGSVVALLVRPWMSRRTAHRVKTAVETDAWSSS